MNGQRFDAWSRTRVLRLSRRSLGVGVLSAALSRLLPASAGAQFGPTCRFTVQLTSSVTPGATATAAMEIVIQENGAIDSGSFDLGQGQPALVVGQTTGRSIDLIVALTDGTMLSLTGQGDTDVSDCNSTLRGHLSNPASAELGTWVAEPGEGTGSEASGQSTQESQTTSGSASSSQSQSSCTATDCSGMLVFDPQMCQCVCPPSTTPCGQLNCCDPETSCLDPGDGLCSCPAGTQLCLNLCVPECGEGETLNLTTCGCDVEQKQVCTELFFFCDDHFECCSGYCAHGVCETCPGRVCGDAGCVDSMTDNNHCGNCNVICVNTTCTGGVCQ
jgi:hypothetical protein